MSFGARQLRSHRPRPVGCDEHRGYECPQRQLKNERERGPFHVDSIYQSRLFERGDRIDPAAASLTSSTSDGALIFSLARSLQACSKEENENAQPNPRLGLRQCHGRLHYVKYELMPLVVALFRCHGCLMLPECR